MSGVGSAAVRGGAPPAQRTWLGAILRLRRGLRIGQRSRRSGLEALSGAGFLPSGASGRFLAALCVAAAFLLGCAHGGGALVLADPALNDFVHNLARHQVATERGPVWYYTVGSSGAPGGGTRLLVLLDGSRLSSVLGVVRNGDIRAPGLAYTLIPHGRRNVDLLAVETTFHVEPFADHRADRRVLERYTLEDRVLAAVAAIDDHLATHRYERVVLLGYSEGAAIVGRVYRGLANGWRVDRLVVGGNGGLSQAEQLAILGRSALPLNERYRAHLLELPEKEREIARAPTAIDRWWLGWPFRRWSTFLRYEPAVDLKEIDIPILCLHGSDDVSSPVESARALSEAFRAAGKPNLVYREYRGLDHRLTEKAFAELMVELFP